MSPTMSLVIGIIIGSFTAMFLIVIIVLKVKTGVDISEIKQVYNILFREKKISRGLIHFLPGGDAEVSVFQSYCS